MCVDFDILATTRVYAHVGEEGSVCALFERLKVSAGGIDSEDLDFGWFI